MPEQAPTPSGTETAGEGISPGGIETSILAKSKIPLFVVAIVVVECLIAYLWLPSASETAAMAGATFGAEDPSSQDDQENEEDLIDRVEVDLGEFSVTAFQPVSNTTLRIDFHLYGMVATDDAEDFDLLLEDNQHRFREQVIVTVRSADITDLTDAGLGLIKRKILEKTNEALGKHLLRGVIFSDFSFLEQ